MAIGIALFAVKKIVSFVFVIGNRNFTTVLFVFLIGLIHYKP